jgi:hypothetical protein
MSQQALKNVEIAGTLLDRYFHVCALFNSREQEYAVLESYYREGLSEGEKALHIVDREIRDDHRARLDTMGVDVSSCEACGQLEVLTPEQTYLEGGEFEPQKMLVTVDTVLRNAHAQGFPRTRIMGNMGWALDDGPRSERLIEYEALVNEVLTRTRQPAICVYDVSRLTGGMMLDILRTHPLTLINGVIQTNPYFTPPDIFLDELKSRRRSRAQA